MGGFVWLFYWPQAISSQTSTLSFESSEAFLKSRTITHSPTLITRGHSLLMYLSIQGFSLRHMHYLTHSLKTIFCQSCIFKHKEVATSRPHLAYTKAFFPSKNALSEIISNKATHHLMIRSVYSVTYPFVPPGGSAPVANPAS